MRVLLRVAAFLVAAAVPPGCDSVFGPHQAAGVFVLQRVAGDSLPATLSFGVDVIVRVYADTIRLEADGRGTMTEETSVEVAPNPPLAPVWDTTALTYAGADGLFTLQLHENCPPNADCAPPPVILARVTSTGLEIDSLGSERVPQTFARVAAF